MIKFNQYNSKLSTLKIPPFFNVLYTVFVSKPYSVNSTRK